VLVFPSRLAIAALVSAGLVTGCSVDRRSPEQIYNDAVVLAKPSAGLGTTAGPPFRVTLPARWAKTKVTPGTVSGRYALVAAQGPRVAGVPARFEVFNDYGDQRTPAEIAASEVGQARSSGATVVTSPATSARLDGREVVSYAVDRRPADGPVVRTTVLLTRSNIELFAVTFTAAPSDVAAAKAQQFFIESWMWQDSATATP
jgi:hypothetical protein